MDKWCELLHDVLVAIKKDPKNTLLKINAELILGGDKSHSLYEETITELDRIGELI